MYLGSTSTLIVAFFLLPSVASHVMVLLPPDIAVMSPSWSTVAIDGFDEDHSSVVFVALLG